MTTPAILAIESMRPLSFVGSQLMHISARLSRFFITDKLERIGQTLEQREGLDYFLRKT